MKKQNKGFTLAELLIVVAIIAVLVAVAIPTLNSQLERSRQSTDLANLRDAYATAKLAVMNGYTPAIDANGVSTLPIKIGFPEESANMKLEDLQKYSGIGYAFVYDADSGLLLPYDNAAYKGTIAVDATTHAITYTNTVTAANKIQECWAAVPAENGLPTGYNAAKTVVVDNTANSITPRTTTALKARALETVIDPESLPGENAGAVEYGVNVTITTPASGLVASDKTVAKLGEANTVHRLWRDTDADWADVRIVVEFSYDKNTQEWALLRIAADPTKEVGAPAAEGAADNGKTDITVGAIRFQNLLNAQGGTTAANLGFRDAFAPHSEKTNRAAAGGNTSG